MAQLGLPAMSAFTPVLNEKPTRQLAELRQPSSNIARTLTKQDRRRSPGSVLVSTVHAMSSR